MRLEAQDTPTSQPSTSAGAWAMGHQYAVVQKLHLGKKKDRGWETYTGLRVAGS